MKTTNQLPGDVAAGTGARGAYVSHFQDAWADVYNAKGSGTKEIMTGLGTRAETLVRGVPFGKTWKLDKRKKIMVAALVASHIAMKTEADLEKYATCGSGTMCLHFPSFFGDDNNKAYELSDAIMSDYKGLVMAKYPGDKTDRPTSCRRARLICLLRHMRMTGSASAKSFIWLIRCISNCRRRSVCWTERCGHVL